MSKRFKPNLPIVCYNLTLRTAQQMHWIEAHNMKPMLAQLLAFFSQVYYVKVLSFNFMGNHWHLVIEMHKPGFDLAEVQRRFELAQTKLVHPRPFYKEQAQHLYDRYTDLSWFMWSFNRGSAYAHNKKMGTKGHLWGRRFYSEVIEDGEHLLNAIVYVEMNGVRAGLVETPEEQEFCSAGQLKRALDAGEKPSVAPIGFLAQVSEEDRPKLFLAWLRDMAKRHHEPAYRNEPSPPEITRLLGNFDQEAFMDSMKEREQRTYGKAIYGSETFIKETLSASSNETRNRKATRILTPRGRGDPTTKN